MSTEIASAGMATAYDHRAVEAAWSARWEAAGLFRADARSSRPRYSIALPPPNVTGELHMGHALNGTVQDACARYRRMRGMEVLWLPGSDHAAIATQNVIERQLAAEGLTKEQLGREGFARRVQAWYDTVRATIVEQYRELGASLDFSRLRFTMDPDYVRSVRTAFCRFWEKGWLYRGPRIVNWCPHDRSAISDLEVEWQEHRDILYRIRYDLEQGGSVVIATVRPETMLADTGVAVHPDDPRYRHLIGRVAILPLVGRRLPVVADAAVDPSFGTGALKVTPGHDQTDWEIGQRHGLAAISALHPDGTMDTPDLPAYDGLGVLEARAAVVHDLEASGHLVGQEPYTHQVGHCDRCGSVIEPLISEQWFLRMDEMAAMAREASRRGEVRWYPERYERTYLDWLAGIRDWCVSRQLWLGHRIPVYTCAEGHTFVSVEEPERCPSCGNHELAQDPDVLDTWFSSALWPFATLGWPDDTEDLRAFYPTAMNSTAREIINLWVSRMIMTGLFFLGRVPFHDVAVHCVVQTPEGKRMSKSKGTAVDPRGIIRTHGADALRAWSAAVAMSSQDVRFDESRIEGFRRFANKLWNATRLVLAGLGEVPPRPAELGLADRWILSRLQVATEAATAGIEGYQFQLAIEGLYDFCWHEFCDWYLEAAKSRLRAGDPAARWVAHRVLHVALRLLHPIMPFVTEELWHRLPDARDFLVRQPWPESETAWRDPEAEAGMARLRAVVEEVRRLRQETRASHRGGRLCLDEQLDPELAGLIAELAQVELVDRLEGGTALAGIAGRVEFGRAAAAGEGSRRRLEAELERTRSRLVDPRFLERAPAAVVEETRRRAAELESALARLG
jgi:valyl-tRNA synthetase